MIFRPTIKVFIFLLGFAGLVFADSTEQVQLPICLAKSLTKPYPVLAKNSKFVIIVDHHDVRITIKPICSALFGLPSLAFK